MVAMGVAAKEKDEKKFERVKKDLHKRIDNSNLNTNLKRDLKAATMELTNMTPKFTLGVLAGEISDIKMDKKQLNIDIEFNQYDQLLQKVFDMGQKQTKKLMEDYGINDFGKKEYLLGDFVKIKVHGGVLGDSNPILDYLPEMDFQGLKIAIENKPGSFRQGKDEHGNSFKAKMFYPYGFIENTEGTDGDEIDCFIGGDEDAKNVYIIHQKVDGKYDEDKCMLGFSTEEAARDAFLAHYDSYEFLGKITTMTVKEFKEALTNHKPGQKLTKE